MNSKITISVILPTYNVGKYIARALDSLIHQTYKNFEIIIVDDCGSDSSIEIAEEYAKEDCRINIITNPKNLGTYHARQIGVEHAKGDYIIFLDPDDELGEEVLQQIQLKAKKEESDIIFFGVKSPIKKKWYEKSPYMFPVNQSHSLFVSYFSNGTRSYLWGTPGKAYKTIFIKKLYNQLNVNNNFRFVYAEDVFLLVNAMLMRPSYSCIYHQGYVYHNNDTSITQSAIGENDEKISQYDFMVESLLQRVSEIDLSKEESKIVDFLKKKLLADRFLLIRHSGSSFDYFKYVAKSVIFLPNTSKFIRLSVFILSLSLLKL